MNTKNIAAALFVPALALAFASQDATKQALQMAMGANAKQMMTYQWKQRIIVVRKGNPSAPIVEELRFDASGQMQRVTLARPEEKHMGPLRARKAASIKEDVQEVMQLARRYANPREMAQAIQRGEVWEGPGAIRVQARSLLLPADDMTLSVDRNSFLATRADFRTQHEGDPVAIAIDYSKLPGGPSVMTRMTVQIPGEGIVVNVESYDFVRLAAPSLP